MTLADDDPITLAEASELLRGKCGWAVVDGYICVTCGDTDPRKAGRRTDDQKAADAVTRRRA